MKQSEKPRIILVPYPAQGHVTPMQKMAIALLNLGFEPIMVLPQYIYNQIVIHNEENHHHHDRFKWVAVADGLEEDTAGDFFGIESAMENTMPSQLKSLIQELQQGGGGVVVCAVVDLLASWAIQVAEKCGIFVAGFWPVMFATYKLVASIPHMVRCGLISETGLPQHEGKFCFIPQLPILDTEDLPWLIGTVAAKKARFKFWTRTLERSRSLKWLLVNSFPDETKLDNSATTLLSLGHLFNHTHTNNPSFWEEDKSCLGWLDTQNPNSVVYISFGSWVSPIGEAKLRSLAMALEALGRPFLWVLKKAWREGLPNAFEERVSRHIGRVVSWAPQMKVLRHKSVACYLTHCGWNSATEAIQFEKKMLCYPMAGDQFLNCAYIVQVWKVGIRLNGLGVKDLEEGLRMLMEDVEMESRLRNLHDIVIGRDDDLKEDRNVRAFIQDFSK
ncbi:UDP-glycosyltransferase 82A1 [Neltuma alba]|uniref:UDP-glycosyltransferase 82A1 n=1 Tax=Neltuma alba TaxID=207710 RepID=UPI0010A3AB32|nr:UDP-glycosyltransferase 82A1 [Prosopis alba]